MSYYKNLMRQFQESIGINDEISKISLDDFVVEFNLWLERRKASGEIYLNLLDDMGVITDETLTYEIGKGKEDIVTKDMDTRIITPYYDETSHINPRRLINGSFCVFRDKPTLVTFGKSGYELTTIRENERITCMTQNPYTNMHIVNWERLHDTGNSKIIVGVYGNTYDTDCSIKLKQLRMFRDKLRNDDYKEESAIFGDTYCHVIASSDNVKRLVKVRTR